MRVGTSPLIELEFKSPVGFVYRTRGQMVVHMHHRSSGIPAVRLISPILK